jgi:hypothetical protein
MSHTGRHSELLPWQRQPLCVIFSIVIEIHLLAADASNEAHLKLNDAMHVPQISFCE